MTNTNRKRLCRSSETHIAFLNFVVAAVGAAAAGAVAAAAVAVAVDAVDAAAVDAAAVDVVAAAAETNVVAAAVASSDTAMDLNKQVVCASWLFHSSSAAHC